MLLSAQTRGKGRQSQHGDNMQIKEYIDKKSKGLAEVVNAGGGYAFSMKRFSPDDGTELIPDIESVDLDDLNIRKAELEAEVVDYATLIADIDKIKTSGK